MKKHTIVRMAEANGGQEVFPTDELTQERQKVKAKKHLEEYLKEIEARAYLYDSTFGC